MRGVLPTLVCVAVLAGCASSGSAPRRVGEDDSAVDTQDDTDGGLDSADTSVPDDTSDSDEDSNAETGDPQAPMADILFVVDNSASMGTYQDRLVDHLDAFLDPLIASDVDWQVGVVATDAEDTDGVLSGSGGYRFLTSASQAPKTVLAGMVLLGTQGSAAEAGLRSVRVALDPPTTEAKSANAGFLRAAADLHIIVVSDEDDQSPAMETVAKMETFLRDLKSAPHTRLSFSALVGTLPNGCDQLSGEAQAPVVYMDMVNAVGGATGVICEADWTAFMASATGQILAPR